MHLHNPRLALAIPTYNRAAILEQNLRTMLPELQEFSLPVYISDDSTNAETKEAIASLKRNYPFLFYRHNDPRLGHDENFFSTLGTPDTDYVWYLGDSVFVKPGGLRAVLHSLESNPDFCFVNAYVKGRPDEHIKPDQMKNFLIDRTWYLTLSGATIYSRKSRAVYVTESKKKQWKNFPQLGFVLEYCSLYRAQCEWLGEPIISINRSKKSYWDKQAFSVFAQDWGALIRSFPTLFTDTVVNKVIRSHSDNMGLFRPWGLLRLRAHNVLNIQTLNEYEKDFSVASGHTMLAKFLCRLPQSACKQCVLLVRMLKQVFGLKHLG